MNGTAFDTELLEKAAEEIDNGNVELMNKFKELEDKLHEMIGRQGTIWAGPRAETFIAGFDNEQPAKMEAIKQKLRDVSDNIRSQERMWANHEEQ